MNIEEKIQSLISAANSTTDETDQDLTEAMSTLINGFENGSAITLYKGSFTPAIYTTNNLPVQHNLNLANGYIYYIVADSISDIYDYESSGDKLIAQAGAFFNIAGTYSALSQSTHTRALRFTSANATNLTYNNGIVYTKDAFGLKYAITSKYNYWVVPLDDIIRG